MSHDSPPLCLWAARAWLDGAWHDNVVLDVGPDGCWQSVTPGQAAPAHAQQLPGPVLPGLVNAHSHAFQRAFAGLAEIRAATQDDFWSWRERMYGVALTLEPADLKRWAVRLYQELLRGGYTQVCEFHYLHHSSSGQPYADPLAMSHALMEAAALTGIGLTLLPVLYERAGFQHTGLRPDQRRFATTPQQVLAFSRAVSEARQPQVNAGVAIHSLRAAHAASIAELLQALDGHDLPIHIHIAEQTGEVDDCLAATGQRPVEWLAGQFRLDPRWQLVHATHTLPQEIDQVARSGAGVVICPSTEANLGDGLTDVPHWLNSGTPLAIGSDSHVTRAWPEELRWLEYGQRLQRRQRNVCADPQLHGGSTAARLFQRGLDGGGTAAGFKRWGLQAGARADLLLLDTQDSTLAEQPAAHMLDALVFSSPVKAFAGVMVSGRWVVQPPAGAQPAKAPPA